MAGMKKLSTRIIHKHATPAEWNVSTFTPYQGEVVIYDPGFDSKDGKTYTRERMKIGDGQHKITELPFVNEINVSATTSKTSVNVVSSVGSSQYTPAEYTAPSMGQELSNDTLVLKFDAGSYTPAEYVAGDSVTTTISYVEDVSVSTEQPL